MDRFELTLTVGVDGCLMGGYRSVIVVVVGIACACVDIICVVVVDNNMGRRIVLIREVVWSKLTGG